MAFTRTTSATALAGFPAWCKERASMRVLIALTLCLSASAASNSPLADAAMRGDKAALRTLLSQKADVNAAQPDGATALQWAAYNDDMEMADLLIAAGANAKAANREGVTALYLAALHPSAPMV